MIRLLGVLAITFGSLMLLTNDVSAAGGSSYYSYRNSYYRLPHTSAHSHVVNIYGARRLFTTDLGYGTRSYNSRRSYSTGYSPGSSYGLFRSPYYSSPYSRGYGYGY